MRFRVKTPAMLATSPGRSLAQMVTVRVLPSGEGAMVQMKSRWPSRPNSRICSTILSAGTDRR